MPPEELDEDIEDLESSPKPDLDAKPKAEPSPATDETDEGALSVVRDAVAEKTKPETAAPSAEGEKVGEDADDDKPKKQDNENFLDVPFHKHPRFQQLLRKSKVHEVDAVRYRNVQTFLDDQGLSAEEAANALTTAALMKSDPVKAWEMLRPAVQKLLQAAGEVLPDDLQQQVTAGAMPRAAAVEVSRARAAVQAVTTRQSFDQQQAERRQQTEQANSLVKAVEDWEAHRRARDPNFDAKLVPMQEKIAFLHVTEGRPNDVEGVRDQLRRAYKSVNDAIPAVVPQVPRKPAIQPVRGGQVAGSMTRADPGSTLEIIRANRRA